MTHHLDTADAVVAGDAAAADESADAVATVVIAEALSVIDDALGRMVTRELVSSGEVADLLLDLRSTLTATPL